MKYKCVVSDLDLTLLGPGSVISPATRHALEKLMEHGIHFVPASGRAFYSFPPELLEMEGIRYAVTSNGASVYDVREKIPIYKSLLPGHVPEQVFSVLGDLPVTYEGFVDSMAYTDQRYYEDPLAFGVNQDTVAYVKATRLPVDGIKEYILNHKEELDCLDIIMDNRYKDQVLNRLRENLKDVYITTSAPHLIEISSLDSGKHVGIRKLSRLLGIHMDEIVAFGDGDNDYEMLLEAGLGICVKNASERCRTAADMETGYNHEDGVAKAIFRIFPELAE